MKYASSLKDVPNTKHYGVFYEDSVSVSGYNDEVSYVNMVKYISFDSEIELKTYITDNVARGKSVHDFVLVEVEPKSIAVDIIITLK